MKLLPTANKTKLVKLLRDKGCDVPSIRQAVFDRHGRAYWLRWWDKNSCSHSAYYSGAAGRPVLLVDKTCLDLTMAEVVKYGLVEQK